MVEKLRKEIEIYKTIDKKEFFNEDDAIYHEKSITTEYVLVGYDPDLNDTGQLTKFGLIEIVNGHNFQEDYAMDVCFKKFGSKIAYVQGNCPTSNWDVLKVLTYAEYLDSKGEYEIIETYKETKGRGY